MPGIDPAIIAHCLSIKEGIRLVVQKVRPLVGERLEAVKQEIMKLETAGFIREVKFQT